MRTSLLITSGWLVQDAIDDVPEALIPFSVLSQLAEEVRIARLDEMQGTICRSGFGWSSAAYNEAYTDFIALRAR